MVLNIEYLLPIKTQRLMLMTINLLTELMGSSGSVLNEPGSMNKVCVYPRVRLLIDPEMITGDRGVW